MCKYNILRSFETDFDELVVIVRIPFRQLVSLALKTTINIRSIANFYIKNKIIICT